MLGPFKNSFSRRRDRDHQAERISWKKYVEWAFKVPKGNLSRRRALLYEVCAFFRPAVDMREEEESEYNKESAIPVF